MGDVRPVIRLQRVDSPRRVIALPPYCGHQPFRNKDYQRGIYDALLEVCPHRHVALDIGAHVGLFTSRFAADFTHTFAFEPELHNFTCLKKNTHGTGAVLVNAGIGKAGIRPLTLYSHNNSGAWSTLPHKKFDPVRSCKAMFLPLGLFQFPAPVSAVKLDIQGMELEALETARDILLEHKPAVCVELRNKESGFDSASYKFLTSLGAEEVCQKNKDYVFKWPE